MYQVYTIENEKEKKLIDSFFKDAEKEMQKIYKKHAKEVWNKLKNNKDNIELVKVYLKILTLTKQEKKEGKNV